MINRIICSFFLIELLVAVSIYMIWMANGVSPHVVQLGGPFLAFIKNCSRELNDFKIAIPDIPHIPVMKDVSGFLVVINALISFFNGFINVLNFVITIFNTIIQLLEFIFIMLKNFITLRDNLAGVTA